ncbi:MAG: hypothetical protein OXJ52_04585 [Oligoflexia bacterium]|nr:hypothetical protein [Oligoflexia bacterium]
MTQKIFYFFLAFFLISCAHTEELSNSLSVATNKEKVWKTLVEIFKSYPLKTIDEPLGYIETEVIKSANFWKAPHQKKKDFSGYSYVLKASLNYNKPISTVTINKKVYKQKGFISQKQEAASDHLEETALLYQIARELEVQALLKKLTR